jgi:hypothetical protein
MNTFQTTRFLGKGAATAAQATIYTAGDETPHTITSLLVYNSDVAARWVKAWMNGQIFRDITIPARDTVNILAAPMGLQEAQTIDIQGEVITVLLWQLHGA